MKIDLTLHSFSLWHHFVHQANFDAISFVDLAKSLGFTGINLSLNDSNYRHLGGQEPERIDRLRTHLETFNMSLEIDTSNTEPTHMRKMLTVAARMGAGTLRTYTHHIGTPLQMMKATKHDLAEIVLDAERLGIIILLENHEDFTGPELRQIVEGVGHPNLKILYDYGNSQMVLEDPMTALDAVLPYVYGVHVKDHVMVHSEHAGQLTVAGVPIGEGFLPISELTKRLLNQGLRRITFENVWAYSVPIRPGRQPLASVTLGEGAFAYLHPPFDPAHVVLDPTAHTGQQLVFLERAALNRGLMWFKTELNKLGCEIKDV